MDLSFPFRFDSRGRTAETDYETHVRDLIEQVLFTAPGERVNRPDFGSALLQLVFGPASDEVATATQFMVEGALNEWLGDLIRVDAVSVEAEDSVLRVRVDYAIRKTGARRTAEFERGGVQG